MGQSDELPNSSSNSEYILVVEDESVIRMMVSDLFREAGFRVIEAFNADEAVCILKSGAPIDLVFSDVKMPGSMDGLGLLAYSQKTFPSLPFLVMSGHLQADEVLSRGARHFLSKPFSFPHALALVEQELAGAA